MAVGRYVGSAVGANVGIVVGENVGTSEGLAVVGLGGPVPVIGFIVGK